jgi:hypothetical protein
MRPERWRQLNPSVVVTDFLRSTEFFTPSLLRFLYYARVPATSPSPSLLSYAGRIRRCLLGSCSPRGCSRAHGLRHACWMRETCSGSGPRTCGLERPPSGTSRQVWAAGHTTTDGSRYAARQVQSLIGGSSDHDLCSDIAQPYPPPSHIQEPGYYPPAPSGPPPHLPPR